MAQSVNNMKKKQFDEISRSHPAFNKNAGPFFSIIMEGLKGEVDGAHFWDAVAENAVFEFLYNFPGFTNKIEGRGAYMDWFGGYSNVLHSADHLRAYKAQGPENVVILEYEVHGVVPSTGKSYDNRFCSIITIKDRKIIHWRDYMDSLAVMLSLTNN
jgi:ketosteroid isomerase-like protein